MGTKVTVTVQVGESSATFIKESGVKFAWAKAADAAEAGAFRAFNILDPKTVDL